LDSSEKALLLKVEPISLVQFRADQEIKVLNLFILTDKSGSKAKFAVRFAGFNDLSEHVSRDNLDLIHDEKTPVCFFDDLKDPLGLLRSLTRVGHHCISGDDNACLFIFIACYPSSPSQDV
jgi:hypothetical protein